MVKDVDYNFVYGDEDWTSLVLPNGLKFLTSALYSRKESAGVTVLVVVSFISLVAVVGLITAIMMSAFNTRTAAAGEHLFVRTQVATYFVCLLLCNMVQSIGSIMNIKWVNEMGVFYGGFCRLQGEVKQTADVGTAIWSLFIAAHTFNLLFLKVEMHRFVLVASVVVGWMLTGAFVIGGPATVNHVRRGPFYGISGYWCWISEGYPTHRIAMDYFVMFFCAFLCFILYILTWLRTRGNIAIKGRHLRFQKAPVTEHWRASDIDNNYTQVVAGRMVMYPVAYFLCILPIAICRFMVWSGHSVPFEATIFADTIFLLFGLVNVILFTTTRRMLPPQSIVKWSPSRRRYQGKSGDGGDSPNSCEKGTKPGELGIYLVEEPALMKSATWDDSFNIHAHPPTPGAPRSPFAGDSSEWEQAQQQASSRPPFTPKPFRLSMSAPRSPVEPRPSIGGGRGWGQTETTQPFTPRPLRLSMMAPTSPNPLGQARSPSAPPGLGRGASASNESPVDSPATPPAWQDRDGGQDLPAEPAPLKPFHLGEAPSGLVRKGSRSRGGSLGGSLGAGSRMRYIAPSPAAPIAEFEDVPQSPFRAVEDELTRMGSSGSSQHESGAWSPSDERAHSPIGRSPSPVRMNMPIPMPHSAMDGLRTASSDGSNYGEEEAEPAFEMLGH